MAQKMEVTVSKRSQTVTITTDQGQIEVKVADLPMTETLMVLVKATRGNVDIETEGAL